MKKSALTLFATLMLGLVFALAMPTEARADNKTWSMSGYHDLDDFSSGNDSITVEGDATLYINHSRTIKWILIRSGFTLTLTGDGTHILRILNTNESEQDHAINGGDSNLIILSGAKIDAKGKNFGIYCKNLTITGGTVTAEGSSSEAICADDSFIIPGESWIKEPANGRIEFSSGYIIADANGARAKKVLITDPTSPSPSPSDDKGKKSSDKKSKKSETHTTPSWVLNPNEKQQLVASFAGLGEGMTIGYQEQGDAAKAAIRKAMLTGYTEAFEFNILNKDRQPEMTLKQGTVTLIIPAEYQKAGRQFSLIALTEGGKTILYSDTDNDPGTITVNLNHTGYAFSLIYKD